MDVREKLIDANYLLNEIRDDHNINGAHFSRIRRHIEVAPDVDAVEVVRCKDCKWYMPGELFTDIMFCHRLKKENGKPAKYNFSADDFCSYGERKEGAD